MEKKCTLVLRGLQQVVIAGFGRALEANRDLICFEDIYYCPNFLEQISKPLFKNSEVFLKLVFVTRVLLMMERVFVVS